MSKKDLTQLLRERANKYGSDHFGVAPIERYRYAPDDHHPRRFLPSVKNVVVVGIRIIRGLTMVQKNQTAYLPYDLFCHGWLSNIPINIVACNVARLIEDFGYHAVPLPFPCETSWLQKRMEEENVSGLMTTLAWPGERFIAFKHSAVAAGLGEFGWHRILLTPSLGPRQRLALVLTDAPLESSPLFEGKLCDPEDCGYRCVNVCPAETLTMDKTIEIKIGKRTYQYSSFNELKCSWVISGLYKSTCAHAPFELTVPDKMTPQLLTVTKDMFHNEPVSGSAYGKYRLACTSSTYCGRCLIACCEYLEEKRKIKNLFDGAAEGEPQTFRPSAGLKGGSIA